MKGLNNKPRMIWLAVVLVLLPVLALGCRLSVPESTMPAPDVSAVEQVDVTEQAAVANPLPVLSEPSEDLLVNLYAQVNPAVVNLTIYTDEDNVLIPSSQGSGFLYDTQGHIVTNAHVVHGSDQVEVTFADATVRIAEVVGQDLNSDLAVVKIEDVPAGVTPLTLGSMEDLAVGQTVIAIGNPFGLDGTLTRGVISALGRTIPALTPFSIPQSIQTDAAINPGNSGGPLLNLAGEVIGVNAQIETDGTSRSNLGVGFAIPVSIVKLVVPDLIENGKHAWAWLGVRGGNLNPSLVEAMDLPVEKGAYLAEVVSGGPSDRAGLKGADDIVTVDNRQVEVGGDVVIAIDGQPVNSFDDMLIYVSLNGKPGQKVTLTIVRDGKERDVDVTLEERPSTLNQAF